MLGRFLPAKHPRSEHAQCSLRGIQLPEFRTRFHRKPSTESWSLAASESALGVAGGITTALRASQCKTCVYNMLEGRGQSGGCWASLPCGTEKTSSFARRTAEGGCPHISGPGSSRHDLGEKRRACKHGLASDASTQDLLRIGGRNYLVDLQNIPRSQAGDIVVSREGSV